MKRQLFYNGKEVHLGDIISDQGKVGDVSYTFSFTLSDEETISNCIKEGILTVKYIKDDPKVGKEFDKEITNKFNISESWEYYIRQYIERYQKESMLSGILSNVFIPDLFVYDKGLFFNILAKEISRELESHYNTPRCSSNIYEISISGNIRQVYEAKKIDSFILDSVACFRTEDDARLALRILKKVYKELYKDTKSEK